MTGLYRVGGSGYYSNGVGSYCAIWSMDQLRGCGWPYDLWALPEFAEHGVPATYTTRERRRGFTQAARSCPAVR